MQPGDTLLLYSDGLVEAHNANARCWVSAIAQFGRGNMAAAPT